jgi:PIN domain nuclease of toxin-antitoxin system
MLVAVADTHAVIWYFANDPRLSDPARNFFETIAKTGDQIGISSISLVEIVYLIEKGRIPPFRFTQLADEITDPDSLLTQIPLELKVSRALARIDVNQIPDMPDRIIAATALFLNLPLISRDAKIVASGLKTIW